MSISNNANTTSTTSGTNANNTNTNTTASDLPRTVVKDVEAKKRIEEAFGMCTLHVRK